MENSKRRGWRTQKPRFGRGSSFTRGVSRQTSDPDGPNGKANEGPEDLFLQEKVAGKKKAFEFESNNEPGFQGFRVQRGRGNGRGMGYSYGSFGSPFENSDWNSGMNPGGNGNPPWMDGELDPGESSSNHEELFNRD